MARSHGQRTRISARTFTDRLHNSCFACETLRVRCSQHEFFARRLAAEPRPRPSPTKQRTAARPRSSSSAAPRACATLRSARPRWTTSLLGPSGRSSHCRCDAARRLLLLPAAGLAVDRQGSHRRSASPSHLATPSTRLPWRCSEAAAAASHRRRAAACRPPRPPARWHRRRPTGHPRRPTVVGPASR